MYGSGRGRPEFREKEKQSTGESRPASGCNRHGKVKGVGTRLDGLGVEGGGGVLVGKGGTR